MPVRHATAWVGTAETVPPPRRPVAPTPTDMKEAAHRPPGVRDGFLQRRLLLRRFVAALTGTPVAEVVVAAAPSGRPCLAAPGAAWQVSTSHRGGQLALALAQCAVGIDLELLQPAAEPAWNILAPAERAALTLLPTAERWAAFLLMWTGKEAYLKATGEGLAREPADIAIEVRGTGFSIRDGGRSIEATTASRLFEHGGRDACRATCVVLGRGARS